MLFLFIFAIIEVFIIFLAYCHDLFIISSKPKLDSLDNIRKDLEENTPNSEMLEGANCITWCAKSGEVLEEKIL